jgi:hypothetical protein
MRGSFSTSLRRQPPGSTPSRASSRNSPNAGRRRMLRTRSDSPSGTVPVLQPVAGRLCYLCPRFGSSGPTLFGLSKGLKPLGSRRVNSFACHGIARALCCSQLDRQLRRQRLTLDVQSRPRTGFHWRDGRTKVAMAALLLPLQCQKRRNSRFEKRVTCLGKFCFQKVIPG